MPGWLRIPAACASRRSQSSSTSRAMARGRLEMVACAACGFVFNAAFDAGLLRYGADYDNAQSHSPAFDRHLTGLAREEPFSLFIELNVMLYAGVLAFVAGLAGLFAMRPRSAHRRARSSWWSCLRPPASG